MTVRVVPYRVTPTAALSMALLLSVVAGAASAYRLASGLLAVGALGFAGLLVVSGAWRSVELAVTLVSACAGVLISAQVGAISAFGVLTIVLASLVWFTWLARARANLNLPLATLPLLVLLLWGLTSIVAPNQLSVPGVQNVLALAVFAGMLTLTAAQTRRRPDYLACLDRTLLWTAGTGVALFMVGFLVPSLGLGFGLGPRGAAAFSGVLLAWFLARWRHGSRSGLVMAALLLIVVALSLSRTALAVSLALLVLAQVKPQRSRDWWRLAAAGRVVLCSAYLGVTRVSAIHARFAQGDLALSIGGMPINAEGRTHLWRATWDSYRQAPLLGHGPGSAQTLITRLYPGIDQPHQDYLRLLHDYGLLGLLLWLGSLGVMLSMTWRAWQRTSPDAPLIASAHLGAMLGLIAVSLLMLTDNVLVYVFVLAPLGAMVGASLGLDRGARDADAPALTLPHQEALATARRRVRA